MFDFAQRESLLRRVEVFLISTVACALLAACVPSLSPAYTDESVLEVEGLSGTWAGGAGVQVMIAGPDALGVYQVSYVNQNKVTVTLETAFTDIGGQIFADLSPVLPASIARDDTLSVLVPKTHTVVAVDISPDQRSMAVRTMSLGWFFAYADSDQGDLDVVQNENFIIASSTDRWRQFIETHPALFDTVPMLFNKK